MSNNASENRPSVNNGNNNCNPTSTDTSPTTNTRPPGPPLASLALQLTRQEWTKLSQQDEDKNALETEDLEVLVERVTALLLIRIVACVAKPGMFPDLSTSMICLTSIQRKRTLWPVSNQVIQQLAVYVKRMLSGYKNVPYHNRQHAYHVILSVNKLLDMMACCFSNIDQVLSNNKPAGSAAATPKKFRPPPSYGLRNEPLAMFAVIFAALIHDVEHQGIPNRQLAAENDRLAVLYNDQSIAENWSLYIAFSELLQDEFVELRQVLFGSDLDSPAHAEQYHNFRKMVINMVLSTDIASPERTQVGKSKWKEAFGDPHETVEAKLMLRRNNINTSIRRLSNYSNCSAHSDSSVGIIVGSNFGGSSSNLNYASSDANTDPSNRSSGNHHHNNLQGRYVPRRMTQESAVSDMTNTIGRRSSGESEADVVGFDEYNDGGPYQNNHHNNNNNNNGASLYYNGDGGFGSLDEVDQDSITPENSQTGDTGVNGGGNNNNAGSATTPTTRTDEDGHFQCSPTPGDCAGRDQSPSEVQEKQHDAVVVENDNQQEQQQPLQDSGTPVTTSASDPHLGSGGGADSTLNLVVKSHHPRYSSSAGNENIGADDKNRPTPSSSSSLNQFLSRSHHRFESRMHRASITGASAAANSSKQYRQRLGILRTVDLGGETLQTYSRHDRDRMSSQATIVFSVTDTELDEPDELKMTVVMETMLAAADVAHNLQSWSHMLTWSKRLYFELRYAHVTGRGADVSAQWFENQIGFLESYVLPLARRLEDTGVFGDETTLPGVQFSQLVEALRDEWIAKGYEFSQELIDEAARHFPLGGGSSNNSSGSAGSHKKAK
ncbi:hypothetical protein ACA910_016613 [Epithemia clementina (nom. ined.)]